MLVSVIVTTYNRPDALRAVLRALLDQSDPNYEIVVADDGSTAATQEMLREFGAMSGPSGLRRRVHAWQPDDGFRAAAARNMAVANSAGSYLIFLDGDCIARPDFVARHRLLAEPGFLVSGSRVLLDEAFTAELLALRSPVPVQRRGIGYWALQRLRRRANKVIPLLRLPNGPLRHYRSVRWKRIKSCNLAIWRSDFEAVNGFDETFVGWGHEDADLVLRLARNGVRRKSGAFATEVFHLWHRENTRGREAENRRRVEERMQSGTVESSIGLSAHPTEQERVQALSS